jgi:predicted SAM-dependent methyltransferase
MDLSGKRVNVGSGHTPLDDHVNVDIFPPADIVGDFMDMRFADVAHVEMSHILEHVPWRHSLNALRIVHSWLAPGGTIHIEVPDMTKLLAMGTDYIGWELAIYGAQVSPGEFHQAGFSVETLVNLSADAGFVVDRVRTFLSEHRERLGYPCIELEGHRP